MSRRGVGAFYILKTNHGNEKTATQLSTYKGDKYEKNRNF